MSSSMVAKQCSGQFFFAGELIEYCGPVTPEGFVLPKGMEIMPWDHPRFFWLTINGRLVAGPARQEVLESFIFQNQDHLLVGQTDSLPCNPTMGGEPSESCRISISSHC